ncbi:MAG TPA: response regulator transcription factor [Anaerolineales bacterium]|jgi:DNA-binding NarL/FixJ family response regulator
MTNIRVVIADDHPVARAGIRKFLEKEPDIQVVAEASSGEEAIELVGELSPDVLLLDMELPGMRGTEVARKLQEIKSPVRVLALSTYDNRQYILGLLASGAAGYLIKEEVPETIIQAVRGVARGEQGWVSRRVAAKMTVWMQMDSTKDTELTEREVEVLRLVVAGKTNQEIGFALGISPRTVEKHVDSLYTKMGVNSRVEAAVSAVRDKLI